MFHSFFNHLKISRHQIRVFVITSTAMFIMMSLQYLGVHMPKIHWLRFNLVSPVAEKNSIFDTLQPLLERKENTYQLKQPTALVPTAEASAEYESARGYVVVDDSSGVVLLSKNAEQEIPIASLTKIMTAIVALDLAKPTDQFVVSKYASKIEPTRAGVVTGEKMSLEELLNAMLITSANDAAQVIKEGIDSKYGQPVFVEAMNDKAAFLGLTKTHFVNPQGFDNPAHYSSPDDLAVLSHYALQNYPLIAQIVQKDFVHLPATNTHKQFDLYNWNGLLDVYPNVSGVKIGNTDAAQKTTIVRAEREGKKLLVVLLGAPGILERDMWASELLDQGFAQFGLKPIEVTEAQLYAKYSTWQYWN